MARKRNYKQTLELLHVALCEASMRLSPLPPPEELARMERIQSGTLGGRNEPDGDGGGSASE